MDQLRDVRELHFGATRLRLPYYPNRGESE